MDSYLEIIERDPDSEWYLVKFCNLPNGFEDQTAKIPYQFLSLVNGEEPLFGKKYVPAYVKILSGLAEGTHAARLHKDSYYHGPLTATVKFLVSDAYFYEPIDGGSVKPKKDFVMTNIILKEID
jgi:hypothetical protein